MSELNQINADVIAERAPWTADTVTNLRTGAKFIAEIDGNPDALTVAAELGEDYRNVILIHVNSDTAAAGILKNDQLQFSLYGATVKCRVLRRRDSGAQAQTDFWVMQNAPQDKT